MAGQGGRRGGPGGKREGAGRKAGIRNKRNEATIAKAEAGGAMPLDIMLAVMRRTYTKAQRLEQQDETTAAQLFADAHRQATDVAPFLHPRLQSIKHEELPIDLSKLTDEQLAALAEFHRLMGR